MSKTSQFSTLPVHYPPARWTRPPVPPHLADRVPTYLWVASTLWRSRVRCAFSQSCQGFPRACSTRSANATVLERSTRPNCGKRSKARMTKPRSSTFRTTKDWAAVASDSDKGCGVAECQQTESVTYTQTGVRSAERHRAGVRHRHREAVV